MVNVENSPVRTLTLFPKIVTFTPRLLVGTGKCLNTIAYVLNGVWVGTAIVQMQLDALRRAYGTAVFAAGVG